MSLGLLTRLRPIGAWRFGPADGSRDRVEPMLHSDSLYAAVTWAMAQLGWRSHWLAETAESAEPSVALTSLFPAFRDLLLVTPPRSAWPPPPSPRVRWKGARFVPLAVVRSLLAGEPLDESRWYVEPESECLLPLEKHSAGGPFRVSHRTSAAVDRGGAGVDLRSAACLEFAREGALWCWAQFRDDSARDLWSRRLQSAFRLLADAGIGGERSSGWGHSLPPRFREGDSSDILLPDHGEGEAFWWVLSTYNPRPEDGIEWQKGSYSISERSGRTSHAGLEKKRVNVVSEGSVLASNARPVGRAVDASPNGMDHPVYASGIAVALRIPAPAWSRSLLYSRLAALSQQPPLEPAPVTPPAEAPAEAAVDYTPEPVPVSEPGTSATEPLEPEVAAAEPAVELGPDLETPAQPDLTQAPASDVEPSPSMTETDIELAVDSESPPQPPDTSETEAATEESASDTTEREGQP